jgi:serine/threonine-protein kinase HipA
MDCNFEIFQAGGWTSAAVLSIIRPEQGGVRGASMLEYELDYIFDNCPEAISLAYPANADIWSGDHWPAFVFDLIPQGSGRKFLLGQLRLPDDPTSDLALICAGAHNPIGRLRVVQAVAFYQQHTARYNTGKLDQGMTRAEVLQRSEDFAEGMLVSGMLAAGTTGIQGAAPKYLLTEAHTGRWHPDGALPDEAAKAHYIVKLARGPSEMDRKVLKNEAAYMDVARQMGLRVHGKLALHDGLLFIPRFDRRVNHGRVFRLHQESAASVSGIIGFDRRPSQFELLDGIRRVVTNPERETAEFLCRDVLNLAMHNTDNHGRNTAVQVIGGMVQLTPLFDFAPMYLDPGGIARAARWHHPSTKRELTVWGDVLDALDVSNQERLRLKGHLAGFGEKLVHLSDVMKRANVDHDIIEHLQLGIDEQVRQLNELRG